MLANVRVGRILGIPIGLHASWFLIFALVTWSLASGYFPLEYPALPGAAYWLLAALTSILFFGPVLLHELGHSVVALRNQIPVGRITLFVFGGVAQIGRESPDAGTEFRVAIAGPLSSLGLAAGFAGLWWLDRATPCLAAPSVCLMSINLMLALFNLIPGFSLDEGRVMRAVIWHLTGNFHRARPAAVFVGELTAFGFIGLGLFTMLTGYWPNGLWLVFIGWFLQNAAATSYAQTSLQQPLRNVTVTQTMTHDCPLVPTHLSLQQPVEEHMLTNGRRCLFVTENDHLRGRLTPTDVTKVPKENWAETTVGQVAVPSELMVRVEPNMPLLIALQVMDDANVNQVLVATGNKMVGMLTREQVLHYVGMRAELGV